jgi:hypothetical protein
MAGPSTASIGVANDPKRHLVWRSGMSAIGAKAEVVYTRSKLRSRPLADMLHDPPFGKDGCYTLSARSSPVMVSNLVMRMTKASLG